MLCKYYTRVTRGQVGTWAQLAVHWMYIACMGQWVVWDQLTGWPNWLQRAIGCEGIIGYELAAWITF